MKCWRSLKAMMKGRHLIWVMIGTLLWAVDARMLAIICWIITITDSVLHND